MGRLIVVVGGQYGSEGKGAVAAHLSQWKRPGVEFDDGELAAVRVAGPNAGHTAVGPDGVAWPLRSVPVAAVVNPTAGLFIAAGSEVDQEVTSQELMALDKAGVLNGRPLYIDGQATILTPEHRAIEGGNDGPLQNRIGSTGKGIGAARADRVNRTAGVFQAEAGACTSLMLQDHLDNDGTVLIEGTQGFGLGLHAGMYPFCTSSDCRASDFLAMTGLSPWSANVTEFEVWVCYRPYPIRVAGNSGPMHEETTWEALGLAEERTTVTKKVRRVGMWDPDLAEAAAIANGAPSQFVHAAFTMADQVVPGAAGYTGLEDSHAEAEQALETWVHRIQGDTGVPVDLIGTGPATMLDLR